MTLQAVSSHLKDFDDFLALLNVPKACELNKPIFKKMFLEASDGKMAILDAVDRKVLKEDVEKIRWLYTLKPNTINIAPYKDKEREYPEIAILHIELASPEKFKRVAQFFNRAIPYSLVLLFTYDTTEQHELLIALADKRVNQADNEKWVIEGSIHTHWISSSVNPAELKFFESLKISNFPFNNFYVFYQAFIARIVAIKCAAHTGEFTLGNVGYHKEDQSSKARLNMLNALEKLQSQRIEISNKLKRITQMGKQVELNTKIKKINDEIVNIKGSL